MRYLINLPLIGAFLCGWALVHLTILTSPPRGGDAGMGAAIAIVGSGFFLWGLLAVVLAGAAMAGGFTWMPGDSRGARAFMVLLAFGAIVLISLLPIGVAMETAGRTDSRVWSPTVIWAARAVAAGLPLVLLAYAAWHINAPETLRDLAGLRYGMIGAVGVLGVVAAAVTVQELGRWNKQASEAAATAREQEDEKVQARRRDFEALSDERHAAQMVRVFNLCVARRHAPRSAAAHRPARQSRDGADERARVGQWALGGGGRAPGGRCAVHAVGGAGASGGAHVSMRSQRSWNDGAKTRHL